jgi:hypothetical protein
MKRLAGRLVGAFAVVVLLVVVGVGLAGIAYVTCVN